MKDLFGFLLLDKEKGLSSFDVVRQVRKLAGTRRVGHSGTLDPLATGLLIIAVGKATRLLEYFQGMDKEYEVTAFFGASSDTYDATGKIKNVSDEVVDRKKIEQTIKKNFLGEIMQMPPKFSALKINGRKAYELARAGEEVKLKKRQIEIFEFKITKFKWPLVSFRVKCSSGTYIRSLVNDLGEILKCGAYVTELRRTKISGLSVNKSWKSDMLNKNIEQCFLKMSDLKKIFSFVKLSKKEFVELKMGRKILNEHEVMRFPAIALYEDQLVGVLKKLNEGKMIRFEKGLF